MEGASGCSVVQWRPFLAATHVVCGSTKFVISDIDMNDTTVFPRVLALLLKERSIVIHLHAQITNHPMEGWTPNPLYIYHWRAEYASLFMPRKTFEPSWQNSKSARIWDGLYENRQQLVNSDLSACYSPSPPRSSHSWAQIGLRHFEAGVQRVSPGKLLPIACRCWWIVYTWM